MTIENDSYLGVICAFRVANTRTSFHFHYTITRKREPAMLMVAGSAATETEAADRVRRYLWHFGDHDATGKITEGGVVRPAAA